MGSGCCACRNSPVMHNILDLQAFSGHRDKRMQLRYAHDSRWPGWSRLGCHLGLNTRQRS